ncbi:MAG: hypothetical protein LC660_04845, partial [Desulfobacteraceae bacterium]|nr:hypothetical protein [Desulfobacteraceae bacterium]
EIRSLIYKLSPPILDDFDIDIAIGFLIEETNARQKTQYHYINHVKNPVPMRHAIKVTLYRAVNELLTNIRKHADTQKAQIQLSVQDQKILLQVEDQGIGMDVEKVNAMPDCGFGIYSLSERIHNFGGTMDIASVRGKGTKITISIPITLEESIHENIHAHHCG